MAGIAVLLAGNLPPSQLATATLALDWLGPIEFPARFPLVAKIEPFVPAFHPIDLK